MSLQQLRDLAHNFHAALGGVSGAEWRKIFTETLQQFELMDREGQWYDPKFAARASDLFPREFGSEQVRAFLDEVVLALEENAYLARFLHALPWQGLTRQKALVLKWAGPETETSYLSYLLAYAYCLDRINAIGREDLEFERSLVARYQARRRQSDFYRFGNLLVIIKLHSIELPLVRFLRAQAEGVLAANFAKFILTANILEAAVADLLFGWWKNARSTLPLMRFHPNFQGVRGKYAAGAPARFSADGLALLLHSPAQREWSDLYQVWNMAFVSQFDIAPFLLAKLMIPSVARYALRPAEYMHTRITALHLALHFLDFAVKDRKLSVDLFRIGPMDKSITRLWGEVNLASARDYQRRVRALAQH